MDLQRSVDVSLEFILVLKRRWKMRRNTRCRERVEIVREAVTGGWWSERSKRRDQRMKMNTGLGVVGNDCDQGTILVCVVLSIISISSMTLLIVIC